MVAKKAKSKRVTLKQKYKIEKKVKQHHKKQRRLAKAGMGKSTKKKRDPGVPNMWPFKEQLMMRAKNAAERREKEEEEQKKRRREAKRARRQAGVAAMEVAEEERSKAAGMAAFMRKAESAADAFESMESERERMEKRGGEMTDGSRRAFYRDFRRVVEESDVLLEVLDARDPLGCQCKSVEDFVTRKHPEKKIVYVLNKIDLVPKDVVVAWKVYLKSRFPVVLFKATTKSQKKNLGRGKMRAGAASTKMLESTQSLGSDALVSLLKNYARSGDIKTSVVVGVIGYPNVGKSSIINSLKRSKVCQAGSAAGVTRTTQLINLDRNIKLIDCPGIVFAASSEDELVLQNAINVQQVADPAACVEAIIARVSPEHLMYTYKIAAFNDVDDFLVLIAEKFGQRARGHIANRTAAAKRVLQDWISGIIPYYTLPPTDDAVSAAHISSQIVAGPGAEFDIDDVSQDAILAEAPEKPASSFAVVAAPGVRDVDAAFLDAAWDETAAMELEDGGGAGPSVGIDTDAIARRDRKKAAGPVAAASDSDSDDAMAAMAARVNVQVNRERKAAMRRAKKETGFITAPPSAPAGSDDSASADDDAVAAVASTSFSLQFDEASSSDAQPVDPNASYSFAHDFRPTAIASDSDSDDSDSGARGMALY